MQETDCRLRGGTAAVIPPDSRSVLPPQAATWVIDPIGLDCLSDFKKDVELIVLGRPDCHFALESLLTRFTFLPGDRHRP